MRKKKINTEINPLFSETIQAYARNIGKQNVNKKKIQDYPPS